ncbi:MAG: hypothetical protein IKX23_01435 [Treponema sp.]|nr:hypothetical protein [Treponema sp.]
MKKLFLIILFTLLPFTIFAGPFGLKMGMTLEEVTEVCGGEKPKSEGDDCYRITPVKNHPLFYEYIVFIDKTQGLYSIIALSKSDSSREIINNTFVEVRGSLSKIYGASEKVDINVSLKDIKYEHVGTYYYCEKWDNELKDDLICISLYATRYGGSYGLVLQYDFTNKSDVEDSQDEVL